MKQNRIVADVKEITWSSLNAAIGNESSLLYKQRMCVENIESMAIFLVDLWSPKTIKKCVVSGEIGVVFFQSRQVGFRSLRRNPNEHRNSCILRETYSSFGQGGK